MLDDAANRPFLTETIDRILEMVNTNSTKLGPAIGRNDASFYMDPERFERERRVIFRESPVFVALSSEMPNPGDTRTDNIDGVPILLVRNKEGVVNAFLNACRHRSAKLVRETCEHAKSRLICPYHAWSYDLNGKLLAVSYSATFGPVQKEELGLVRLSCAEKYGMIYVVLTPDVEIDIDALMGDHLDPMQNWHLEDTTYAGTTRIETKTNWKLALDTYCENYHLLTAHPTTLGVTKINNCGDTWRFGYKNRSHAITFPDKTILELGAQDAADWQPLKHFSIIYYLYPNTICSIFPHMTLFWRILPGKTVGESITIGTSFARGRDASPEALEAARAGLKRVEDLLILEDYPLSRDAMEAFESGLMPYSLFGRNELEVFAMHEAIDEHLRAGN